MSSERKATVTYTGDGVQLKYSFPFDYLRKAFVKVQDISGDNIKDLVLGTDYSIDDKQVSLANPIPSGDHLKIYRQTTTEPLVEWQDASVLRSADLSLQEVQLLHLSEETLDRVQEGGLSTDPQDTDSWDARFKRLKNLLDPREDGDAVTLRYVKNSRDGIITEINSAGTLNVKNVTTEGDKQTKRVTTTGDSYVTQMTSLKDMTTTKASESADSAELSKAWAMSSTSPDNTDSKSSKTWAEEAKGHAGNAKTSATNAKTSETNAKHSETNANSYMTNANAYMTNASDSATKAKASEDNAKTSEINAAKSEQDAKTHADNAAQYDPRELIDEAYHRIKRDTAYEVGDVLTSTNLPYDVVIDVTQAGTTGTTDPDWESIKDDIGNSQAGATSIQELKDQVAELLRASAYRPNDVIQVDRLELVGYITGGTKDAKFWVQLPKPIAPEVKSIVMSGRVRLRQNGNYAADYDTTYGFDTSNGTDSSYAMGELGFGLTVRMAGGVAFPNMTNNDCVSGEFMNIKIEFKA